ncbi:chorismate mutase [Streptomyces sp. HM190]|uniref:chorismate mutase n=1 Tax=Streptomyces sp. HM190 TaxID=2695266 RepID=UPI00135A5FDA|nr:chorismate mutase [Streptomyces sp. HM190]
MTTPTAEKTTPTAEKTTPTAEKTVTTAEKTATDETATGKTAAERTGARTEEAAGVISGARERIDALDDRIIGLVQERMAVSAVIQQARIESGGRRVNLSREMEVLAHYSDALGRPGTALAMTLLELCRGRV